LQTVYKYESEYKVINQKFLDIAIQRLGPFIYTEAYNVPVNPAGEISEVVPERVKSMVFSPTM
jgi:hypothetical protein